MNKEYCFTYEIEKSVIAESEDAAHEKLRDVFIDDEDILFEIQQDICEPENWKLISVYNAPEN